MIYACIEDNCGKLISEDFQFAKPERKLQFSEAKLSMRKVGERLLEITSDRFARCVELHGDADGDLFGWHFEDNYFDMMPGQKKRIRLLEKHSSGKITAKAYYSRHRAEIRL